MIRVWQPCAFGTCVGAGSPRLNQHNPAHLERLTLNLPELDVKISPPHLTILNTIHRRVGDGKQRPAEGAAAAGCTTLELHRKQKQPVLLRLTSRSGCARVVEACFLEPIKTSPTCLTAPSSPRLTSLGAPRLRLRCVLAAATRKNADNTIMAIEDLTPSTWRTLHHRALPASPHHCATTPADHQQLTCCTVTRYRNFPKHYAMQNASKPHHVARVQHKYNYMVIQESSSPVTGCRMQSSGSGPPCNLRDSKNVNEFYNVRRSSRPRMPPRRTRSAPTSLRRTAQDGKRADELPVDKQSAPPMDTRNDRRVGLLVSDVPCEQCNRALGHFVWWYCGGGARVALVHIRHGAAATCRHCQPRGSVRGRCVISLVSYPYLHAAVTPLVLPVSMGGADHLPSGTILWSIKHISEMRFVVNNSVFHANTHTYTQQTCSVNSAALCAWRGADQSAGNYALSDK
ncbi:unnamed protein product [Spodoptera exigua]|nr:unnamed protein product [Spodoptera exigua]